MKNNISKEVFFKRKNCRICSSDNLELALEMGISPISEKYLIKENLEENSPKAPLDLYFCKD